MPAQNSCESYLIYLLRCALEGKSADEKSGDFTYEDVYSLALRHSVANMAFYALEDSSCEISAELFSKWKNTRDVEIVKSLTQISEKNRIIRLLTENGIDVLPLKGCYLKEMYPQNDFRQMADLDLLVREDDADRAEKVLTDSGYALKSRCSHHSSFFLPPYVNIELHTSLISEGNDSRSYFLSFWDRAFASNENPHLFSVSWSDYYLFFIAHLAKHYYGSGCGIRNIMDCFILNRAHGADIDRDYTDSELQKLGLYEFACECEKIDESWFGNGSQVDGFSQTEKYIFKSGTYGRLDFKVANGIKGCNNNRLVYIISRIWMPYRLLKLSYPVLEKAPFLMPFCEVHRLVSAFFRKRNILRIEFEVLKNKKR